jgi:hypothetical protein
MNFRGLKPVGVLDVVGAVIISAVVVAIPVALRIILALLPKCERVRSC